MQLRRQIVLIFFSIILAGSVDARDYRIFDVHIHYSHDVWQGIDPDDAIQRLKEGGIHRVMVSASGQGGAERMHQANPTFAIPALRPYRKRSDVDGWMHDETVIDYLQQQLKKHRYAALGEFHVNNSEVDLPVVKQTIALAKHYSLIMHVHSNADAIHRIFRQYPEATIIWAHAGFEYGSTVEELLDKYPNLYADLSFRREIFVNGRFLQNWKALLIKHADRFMLGVDTYTPQGWLKIRKVVHYFHTLLDALPEDVANKIAWQNADNVIAKHFTTNQD